MLWLVIRQINFWLLDNEMKYCEAFHSICTTPQKKISEWSQTFPAGLVGSTDSQEALGTLRNSKLSSQELLEQTNPPKFLIFGSIFEKKVFIHISVSFWVSEVFHTSFRPEFWCRPLGGPKKFWLGQIWPLWPKTSIFTTQVRGQKWKCSPPPQILTQWFLRSKNAIFS